MTPDTAAPPTATYRLQLQPGFPFRAAERAVPHLAALGVSHLHLSPVLEAVPGSRHGYDVTDHSAVRAELGGEEGLRALARTARAHGLGLILDIVPNHMAVPASVRLNGPLWRVLRDGPASPYARWFDIDWSEHGGKVLLPVLAGRLGDELAHFRVEHGTTEGGGNGGGDRDVLRYRDHVLPLRPGSERLPLPELLDAQWYRPAWWRLARTELNYRRFFTVNQLIAVRVEDPEVFDATHAKVVQLLREGVLDGLRVDHPDGLADPAGYLRRLAEATEGRWTVVEKILSGDERLPAGWPVAGTTGYDALRHLDGLFVDPAGAAELGARYRAFTGLPPDRGGDWPATQRRAAYKVITHELAAEVERLVRTAGRVCETSLPLRDHAPWALRTALREILVRLPVYRPYAVPGKPVTPVDATLLDQAAQGARAAFAVPEEALVVETVRDAALGRLGAGPEHRDFCARFAQTASALRAKSVEDTAFYRHAPLLSATEVGGVPDRPSVAPADFHAYCARIQRDWPATGTVLSTHDTKRSADLRARIAALSEFPHRWGELMDRVADGSADGGVPGDAAPDRHVAWLAWQSVFGLGTPDPERLAPALLKSVREAGLRTTWTEPDAAYEAAVEAYAHAGPCGPAHAELGPLEEALAPAVRANTLGAALLHLTMPGVPEVYMGTERLRTALVDPDNRRVPDFPGAGDTGLSAEKLRLTGTALRLRRAHPEWFGADGSYTPLTALGPAAGHCVAFVRSGAAVSVATRLRGRLAEAGGWRGTALELPGGGRWRELLTDRAVTGRVGLAELLDGWPVALLVRD
ncbi:malto-oligosyltrehalose synthase [Streptomyces albireticuli]|uniref:Malto-oligosyltrehalose synthase n=1 Tax=Streptomyces albireticuli TaxID=1940 RepID=A0A2A2DCJ3_9ACTN|nr:malto-oligosyltrehalose synthase [Streptomyces albireticuli]MCD9140638.1 malto-oligosyltrehalose synthase [Streptomyces albireticuli]MCD9161400.1 malto-oligosyltrehalose synthase [Streptomyces albireticuli]MCD9193030.1 malto-oligosyltrehalose synthase [Streptomyces albireticuli]PAU50193.1 malto-oligosyltrehalose synthase [Streptomyces albireticuli]